MLEDDMQSELPDSGGEVAEDDYVHYIGEKPQFDFETKDYITIIEMLKILDWERAYKVSGSGFYYWVGKGAELAQAMYFWAQKELVKRGFELFMPPCLVKRKIFTLLSRVKIERESESKLNFLGRISKLFLPINTSEYTLVGYHENELIDAKTLPRFYVAYTPCFRTKINSMYSRGIFNSRQFHKVEQIVFCLPDESRECHEKCLTNEEDLLRFLGIPYKVVKASTPDSGDTYHVDKYDIYAWYPGSKCYYEVMSNTNFKDEQSRSLQILYQDKDGKSDFVHTISATGLTDRVVYAILENNQRKDGSVVVPEVLRPYTGFDVIEPLGK